VKLVHLVGFITKKSPTLLESEDGATRLLRNVGNFLPLDTA